MKVLLREALYLAIATCVSWWLFLRPTPEAGVVARVSPGPMLPVELTPLLITDGESEQTPAAPDDAVPDDAASDEPRADGAVPLPAELGTPEGDAEEPGARVPEDAPNDAPEELLASAADAERESLEEAVESEDPPPTDEAATADPAPAPNEVAQLMRDPELLATATAEISGEERHGFTTVFLAKPEDQLEIARFFGEELVLVPRAAIDPGTTDPRWFRVDGGSDRVEEVRGRPPLESYRQYRDLLDYEYARLPDLVRELRRQVVSRRDVYVFAALVPAREWAVVVARRNEVLASAGRTLADVRSFVLRYVDLGEGEFDLAVDHVIFADGKRYRSPSTEGEGARTQ